MIPGYSAITQALLGSLFTWGVTAAGAALVFVFEVARFSRSTEKRILDGSLGFAAGVMTAATFWSLLTPALEIAEGAWGARAWIPVAIGFLVGALGMAWLEGVLPDDSLVLSHASRPVAVREGPHAPPRRSARRRATAAGTERTHAAATEDHEHPAQATKEEIKRLLMLVIAITMHNFPEGLAVGVAFGAVGVVEKASFSSAVALAIGIGIQNFPEGMAVSLPLRRGGVPSWKAFWYGQLSGVVEPLGALLGAAAVLAARQLLPYALSFAGGAMMFVVYAHLIPDAVAGGRAFAANAAALGFTVMMVLDVALA